MVEIIINENLTKIKTENITFFIKGSFEIKKEGAEAPIIKINGTKVGEQIVPSIMNTLKNAGSINS